MGATPIAASSAPSVYQFGDCELNPAARELRRSDLVVHLQPKAFDLLCYLVQMRDRVVSKDELLESLWPDEVVAETSLTFAIKAVRRALGDDGSAQRFVRTAHGRGYRFVAAIRGATTGDTTSPEAERRTLAARERILLQPAVARFVGRSHERTTLESELATAGAGQTRTVFVLGDPGVGKSRLAAEFAGDAEAGGAIVLVGRCDDGAPPAMWAWVQAVRSFVEQFGRDAAREACGDGLRDIARVIPGLAPAAEHEPTAEVDLEHARLRLFDSMVGFLREISRARTVLVVLDDLHWADASSLLVLRHLMRELLDSRLLVLGTYRHTEVAPESPLSHLLGWLHRTRRTTRIKLLGLDDEDVGTMMRELSGKAPSDDLVATLGRATEGNPFFVEEFCREIRDFDGVDAAANIAKIVPEQVRDLLMQRVSRLDAIARRVLAFAAILGREFDSVDLLAAFASRDGQDDEVFRAMAAAEASGLLHASASRPGSFVFTHALVVEVLRENLASVERAEIHRAVGRSLERRTGGDALRTTTALAYHYAEAVAVGEAARAFYWQRVAGDMLVTRFAYEDAAAHYARALSLARDGACDETDLYELLLALARASYRSGGEVHSRDLLAEAVAIARRAGDTTMLARAALGTVTLFPVTPPEGIALLEEALAALRATPDVDPGLLSRVLSALASGLYARPDEVDRREALVDEAMTLARSTDDRRTLLRVVRASHVALWRPGHLARRLALAREHVGIADVSGNLIEIASARVWYLPALIESGDIAEADRQIELLDREATESRMQVYRANALSSRAMRALTRGAFEEVEFLARRAYEMSQRFSEATASMTLWAQIYYLRREQQRLAEIEAGLQMFAAQVSHVPWDWLVLHLHCEDGRISEARPMFERMRDSDFTDGVPPDAHIAAAAALFGLVESCWRLRDAGAAARLLPRLEQYQGQWVTVGLGGVCLGSVAYATGLALASVGRTDEAIGSLEQAEREHVEADMPVLAARTRAELASVLFTRRDRESRKRARELVELARRDAEALGLVNVLGILEAAGA